MNESTHWQYVISPDKAQAVIVDYEGTTVADISATENTTAHSNLEASVRLMNAAPELLALLREAHDAIATGDGDFSPSGDWFREASAAIEKATGELADEVCPYHEWDCR